MMNIYLIDQMMKIYLIDQIFTKFSKLFFVFKFQNKNFLKMVSLFNNFYFYSRKYFNNYLAIKFQSTERS